MKVFTVYLAGPMEGCTKEGMTGWRGLAKHRLEAWGIHCLDPTRRTPFHETGREPQLARVLFYADIRDIDQSDLVLADVRVDSGRGSGTSMELMYSWMNKKPIVLVANTSDPVHPFHEVMQMSRHATVEQATDMILKFAGKI
jgi:nucleoside 2-deoxyribosyltransferase